MVPQLMVVFGAAAAAPAIDPTVFWVSQPARPNETALVQGSGLRNVTAVKVRAAGSATPAMSVPVTEASDAGLHFVLPPQLAWPAIYELELSPSSTSDATRTAINAPRVQWLQGDKGDASSAGGWVRAFGACLRLPSTKGGSGGGAGARVRAEQALRLALDRRDAPAIARHSETLGRLG
jgi:hypothetical protein